MTPQDPRKPKGLAIIIGAKPSDGPDGLRSPEDTEPDPMDPGDDTSSQKCSGCKFYAPDAGECKRYPPHGNEWAMVMPDDWCGEFMAGMPHSSGAPDMGGMGHNLGAMAPGAPGNMS